MDLFNRRLAPARTSVDHADSACSDQGGNAVCRWRCIAEIATKARAALYLRRADQPSSLDHAWPRCAQRLVLVDRCRRCRSPDFEAVGGFADLGHLRNALEIDDCRGLHPARAHLNQKVGSARKQARALAGAFQRSDGFINCSGSYVVRCWQPTLPVFRGDNLGARPAAAKSVAGISSWQAVERQSKSAATSSARTS